MCPLLRPNLKGKENRIDIQSEKEKKRKIKCWCPKHSITMLLCWYSLTCFLSEDMNLLVEFLRYQFFSLFQILLLFPHYSKSLIFLLPSLFPSFYPFLAFFYSFFYSLSSCFFSSSFCFCYSSFPYFSLHCFPHFSRHLIIFTSPILQSISGLW